MAGLLFHSPRFGRTWYVGADGLQHYELDYGTGAQESVTVSTWRETVKYFSDLGVSEDLWPFYEGDIDLPLEEIHELSEKLRDALSRLEWSGDVPRVAKMVVAALRANEDVVYCF